MTSLRAPRVAVPSDAVRGLVPSEVHEPTSIDEAVAVLASLAKRGAASVFVGGGTKLGLGRAPSRLDAVIRTGGLAQIVDYAPSDQVITVEAGVTLGALQAALAKEGQRLSLDPPWPATSTVGGIVATNAFGPLRTRCGSIRDLILGVSLIRADGVLAKGGGKVVKNVAGFDLPKLACGSMGTLAMIASITLRVHPLPRAESTRTVRGLRADGVPALLRTARAAQLEPVALLAVQTPGGEGTWDVTFRFEGFAAGVAQQVDRLATLAKAESVGADAFEAHRLARERAALRIKVAALPNAIAAVEAALSPLSRLLVETELAWYPTLGVGFLSAPALAPAVAAAIADARRAIHALGGSLTVETMPDDLRASVSVWDAPRAVGLHEAMKARFDPDRLLAPDTFVGGI